MAVHWVAVGQATPFTAVAGVDRGGGGGARVGRVERDLLPAGVDGGALGWRLGRQPRLQAVAGVDRGGGGGVPGFGRVWNVTCRPLLIDGGALGSGRARHPIQDVGVDWGGGGGARVGRVECDLLPAEVKSGALGGGRARNPIQDLVAVLVDRCGARPRQLRKRSRRQPAGDGTQRNQHDQRPPNSDRHNTTRRPHRPAAGQPADNGHHHRLLIGATSNPRDRRFRPSPSFDPGPVLVRGSERPSPQPTRTLTTRERRRAWVLYPNARVDAG